MAFSMKKDMLSKADMPPAKSKDSMLSMEGLDFEGEESPEAPAEEPMKDEEASAFADASDDELLKELKKRGYEVPEAEGKEMEEDDFASMPVEEEEEKEGGPGATFPTSVMGPNAKKKKI